MSWQLVPEFPPGTRGSGCSVCGSDLRTRNAGTAEHERALDPGIFIDFEGHFVICESCIIEAANLLGMAQAQHVIALQAQVGGLERQLQDSEGRRRNAEGVMSALIQQAADA